MASPTRGWFGGLNLQDLFRSAELRSRRYRRRAGIRSKALKADAIEQQPAGFGRGDTRKQREAKLAHISEAEREVVRKLVEDLVEGVCFTAGS
jgi:hypothetical protein